MKEEEDPSERPEDLVQASHSGVHEAVKTEPDNKEEEENANEEDDEDDEDEEQEYEDVRVRRITW